MSFHPDYVRLVLNEHFEDAKHLLLDPMMAIHEAHLAMLAEQGIVTRDEARRLRDAIRAVDLASVRATPFPGTCEDLFNHLDTLLTAACGAEVAGRLHTARSRNDIAMTMYRMVGRRYLVGYADALLRVRGSLLALAAQHVETVFPAHTHTQVAQPTTVAHYLLAVIEQLERDTTRVTAAHRTTNRCPLGACAITGTGFPIDRRRTSELLGFDEPTGNTYGSIASVDYLLEGVSAIDIAVVGLGRVVQDLLLWCTSEVGYLRLSDGFVQVSSIMPQKRNPVALEHARALLSKSHGGLQAITAMVHNTPFGDIVDTEDDLQPLVASAVRDAARGTELVAAAMTEAEFDVGRMRDRAALGWITITELADTLVREHKVAFSAAHRSASLLIAAAGTAPGASLADLLAAVTKDVVGREIRLPADEIDRALNPEWFVAIRRTPGGPAPDVVRAALEIARKAQARDAGHLAGLRASVDAAAERRRGALDQL